MASLDRYPITVTAPAGSACQTRIYRSDGTSAAVAYDAATAGSAVTQPVALAPGGSQVFYVPEQDYQISAIVSGVELAGGYGVKQKVNVTGAVTVNPDPSLIAKNEAPSDSLLRHVVTGTLTVLAGTLRYSFPEAVTILGVTLTCNTAPTGTAILVDVNKNGTTIFTTQGNRPTIAISGFATAAEVTNAEVTALAAGDYLTIDVDQIGSGVAGSNLVATIRYR